MNDQSQMMSQSKILSQPQMINPVPMMSQPPIMGQPQPPLMNQSQAMNQQHQPQPQLMNAPQMRMNPSPPQLPMLNRGYNKVWSQQVPMDPNKKFQNPPKHNNNYQIPKPSKLGRSNWKGKKVTDQRKDPRRMDKPLPIPSTSMTGPTMASGGGYKPPSLHELQSQNRLKARKFYPKKKFNNRFAPYAPRNTTSFIIRAKKAGGIASLVSPCPVTPAVLPTPIFSPSREVLGDMAKEEWGVDGYGSMKGLIRLRSPGNEADLHEEEEDEEGGGGSSESDVEEHVEVERRLDHDLSRFEMIYPNYGGDYNNVLENRVDDQDSHIAQLEEENLILKERIYLMERELGDLRRRLQFLERQNQVVEDVNEEVVENRSENESEGGSDAPTMGLGNVGDIVEYVTENERVGNIDTDTKRDGNELLKSQGGDPDVCMEQNVPSVSREIITKENEIRDEEVGNACVLNDNKVLEDRLDDEEATKHFVSDKVVAKENYVSDKREETDFMVCQEMVSKDGPKNQETNIENLKDEAVASKNDRKNGY